MIKIIQKNNREEMIDSKDQLLAFRPDNETKWSLVKCLVCFADNTEANIPIGVCSSCGYDINKDDEE